MSETVFTNARIVAGDTIVDGSVLVRDGAIAAVETGRSAAAGAIDLAGDYLMPGLVELHTDNLEKHMTPRPSVRWPAEAAVLAHDMQVAAAGFTTVFDAIAVGEMHYGTDRLRNLEIVVDALRATTAAAMLKVEHLLHFRLEISQPGVVELFAPFHDEALVRLVSLMDHTPGQRQFTHVDRYRSYYMQRHRVSAVEFDAFLADRQQRGAENSAVNRRALVALCRGRRWPMASHDDATLAHVAEAVGDGMAIAEFPTTIEAADASHRAGMRVLVGAPNVVRGGSHSGNVSASELAEKGIVDILSSDYFPQSLLHGALLLTQDPIGMTLPAAIATVTANPAAAVGLDDRGVIATGKRADLIRVRVVKDLPVVRAVWRAGERIA